MTTRDDNLAVLGLKGNATETEIKKAYRNLAWLYHPNGKQPDTARFIEVTKAYEALSHSSRDDDEADATRTRGEGKAQKASERAPGRSKDAEDIGNMFRDGSVPPVPPPPSEPESPIPRPVPPVILSLGGIVLWALLIVVVSFGMSLAGAYLARHSVGMPGDIHEFIPMTEYLLELSIVTGVPAFAAVAVTELLSRLNGEPWGKYKPVMILRGRIYFLTLIAAAVVLLVLYELRYFGPFIRLGPNSYVPPFWWWIIGPASLCLAHVLSLTADRWRARASLNVLMIPMAASCGAIACGLLFTWPLPTLGSPPTSIVPLYPASFRPCESVPPPRGPATAAVRCHPDGVSIFIRVGNDRIDQEFVPGVPAYEPCPKAMPALHAFYVGNERRGSLMCRYNTNGHVVLAWTDLRTNGYTKATFDDSYNFNTAYQWWVAHAYEGDPAPTPRPRD